MTSSILRGLLSQPLKTMFDDDDDGGDDGDDPLKTGQGHGMSAYFLFYWLRPQPTVYQGLE